MPARVFFLTGPSGAGKSTAARLWARTRAAPCALIDHDEVRHFVKSGFADPGQRWDATAQEQWEVARVICCDMARRYVHAHIDCILDTFSPPDDFRHWDDGLHGMAVRVVVLLPSLAVALSRNAQRSGDALLREESIRENYGWIADWHGVPTALIIDNGAISPSDTVRRIEQTLARPG